MMTTWRVIRMVLAGGVLLAAGCHRPPQTAAELAKALPHAYAGELHLQGETEARRIRLEPRELSIRSEHVLEFNRVAYEFDNAHGAAEASGEAGIRGTIDAPGLAIHLEIGGEDAVRPETFTGKLSEDMKSLEAEWTTGLGQKARLKLEAVKKP